MDQMKLPSVFRARAAAPRPTPRRRKGSRSPPGRSPRDGAPASDGVRTFDAATGQVVINKHGIPSRVALVNEHYSTFLRDPQKVREVGDYVSRLPLQRQRELAVESVKRKNAAEYERMVQRDVFDEAISRQRAQVSLRMSVENMVGNLHHDTRELSLIRIHSAAVDSLLHQEAERLADRAIKQHLAKVVPDSTTSVDILEMTLDAWRRRHVPEPPRRVIEPPNRRQSVRRASFRNVPSPRDVG
jgi:hypothetical protein